MAATTWKKVALSGDIVNADINASAGIAQTKISGLSTSLAGKVPTTRTVNGNALTSNVTLVKADVGLGSVDDTSDAGKPISTLTQSALDVKAPLASPAFTGSPTAPTQTAGDNTTKLATTAFVTTAVASENTLVEMNDVNISSIANDDIIAYDSASQKYINQSASEAGLAVSGHNHSGTYEPADSAIQTHVANDTKHRLINDSGTTTTVLFSASKIISELATKEDTHSHPYLSNSHDASGVTSAKISNWDGVHSWYQTMIAENDADAVIDTVQEIINTFEGFDTEAVNLATMFASRSEMLVGAIPPASGLGTDGDFYRDTAGNNLYVKV